MIKIEYECVILTPMVVRGAEQETIEIRIPSIKGVMRYWWRVLNSETDIHKLREEEGKIFGCIGKKNKAVKSNVKIRSFFIGTPRFEKEIDFFPFKRDKKCPKIGGLNAGTKFAVQFLINEKAYTTEGSEAKSNKQIAKEVEDTFEKMALLGGLGRRTRRGFGAFKIEKKTKTIINQGKPEVTVEPCISMDNILKEEMIYSKNFLHAKKIIVFEPEFEDESEIVCIIDKVTHKQRLELSKKYRWKVDKALGSANNHQASPLYISVFQQDDKFKLVITVLEEKKDKVNQEIQAKFIEQLRREYES